MAVRDVACVVDIKCDGRGFARVGVHPGVDERIGLPEGAGAGPASAPLTIGIAGVGVHTLAMLSVTVASATVVYEWVGLEILRTAWIDIDALWVMGLLATGALMLLSALSEDAARHSYRRDHASSPRSRRR